MNLADRAILDADPWFSRLPPGRRDRLLEQGRTRRFADGACVYGYGDLPNGLWAVLEGEVRLKGYPTPATEFLALTLRPGNWFGELSTIDEDVRPHDALAFGSARLLHVPMAAFSRLAATLPGLYHDLGRLVCQRERMALEFITQIVATPPRMRLARLLLTRTDERVDALRVRQEDLAVMLGVSRQTLNRHLGALVATGAISLSYGRIEVTNRALLLQQANIASI